MRPHLKGYWCIPKKQDADFVACMEDIIDVYERPYARKRPVVCLDEKPLQLLGEVREPLPMRPGAVEKIDAEYKRNGTCSIFAIVEPLTGHQHISVRERRTALDWAEEIQYLCDVMYPRAERIVLVMDNLNTHALGSLYKRFKPDVARRLAGRLPPVYMSSSIARASTSSAWAPWGDFLRYRSSDCFAPVMSLIPSWFIARP